MNEYPAWRIYDSELQSKLWHENVPSAPAGQMLPFLYAPYLAPCFRPLGRLPYFWAYIVWLGVSLAAYAASVRLLKRQHSNTAVVLALSTPVFLFETWNGGQISFLACLVWAVFFRLSAGKREFSAGAALALLLYKPTLAGIPALMLIASRRWRAVGGFCAGACALALASLAAVGWEGFRHWLAALQLHSRAATGAESPFRLMKYTDINSFLRLIGVSGNTALMASLALASAGVAVLFAIWLRARTWPEASKNLLWAATIAASLLLNVYSPIYDTLTLVPASLLAATALRDVAESDRTAFAYWLALLYLLPWLTQSIASITGVQLMTVAITCFAGWLLRTAYRLAGQDVLTSSRTN
jgi:hypothetical protein